MGYQLSSKQFKKLFRFFQIQTLVTYTPRNVGHLYRFMKFLSGYVANFKNAKPLGCNILFHSRIYKGGTGSSCSTSSIHLSYGVGVVDASVSVQVSSSVDLVWQVNI